MEAIEMRIGGRWTTASQTCNIIMYSNCAVCECVFFLVPLFGKHSFNFDFSWNVCTPCARERKRKKIEPYTTNFITFFHWQKEKPEEMNRNETKQNGKLPDF